MKQVFTILASFLLGLSWAQPVFAQPSELVPVSVIVREDCVHCQDEKAFLKVLETTRSDLKIIFHDIDTPDGKSIFDQLTSKENLSKSTPITLVGNTIIQGFENAETTGKRIEH